MQWRTAPGTVPGDIRVSGSTLARRVASTRGNWLTLLCSKNKRLHFNYDNDIIMQITNEDISNYDNDIMMQITNEDISNL